MARTISDDLLWQCWNVMWGDVSGVYHVSSLGTDKIRKMLEFYQQQEADNAR